MALKIEPISIQITTDDNHGHINMAWADDGVAEISLSDSFFIDENTIKQLTPVIMKAFKELMK